MSLLSHWSDAQQYFVCPNAESMIARKINAVSIAIQYYLRNSVYLASPIENLSSQLPTLSDKNQHSFRCACVYYCAIIQMDIKKFKSYSLLSMLDPIQPLFNLIKLAITVVCINVLISVASYKNTQCLVEIIIHVKYHFFI